MPTFHLSESIVNEMIQYASQLDYQDYSTFQSCMVKKFYADANIDVLDQLVTFAKNSTLPTITRNNLSKIVALILPSITKEYYNPNITSAQHKENIKNAIIELENGDIHIVFHDSAKNRDYYITQWDYLLKDIQSNVVSLHIRTYPDRGSVSVNALSQLCGTIQNILMVHMQFVNIIWNIYSMAQSSKYESKVNQLEQKNICLLNEINELKQKNADLAYQVQLNTYTLGINQGTNPSYDYESIKARKKNLHSEFKRIVKLMKLNL